MFYKSYKKLDPLGRVLLPKDFRKELNWKENEDILIEIKDDTVVISKAEQNCVFCGKTDNLKSYKGKTVCKSCIKALNNS